MLSFDAIKDINCIEISKAIAHNVSRVCEVAEIGAEYFLLPKTNLVKKDILLPENQQFRHKRCYRLPYTFLFIMS